MTNNLIVHCSGFEWSSAYSFWWVYRGWRRPSPFGLEEVLTFG